jgi:hypothetical protein
MAAKSSENEDKGFAIYATELQKSGRNHKKVHQSGRGEVTSFVLVPLVTFFLFFGQNSFSQIR